MKTKSRSSNFWYNVLCVSALTYNLFFVIVLIIGFFNISILEKTFSNYTELGMKNVHLYFHIIAMLSLNLLASFGIFKLFSFLKTGFYIYLISTTSLILYKILFTATNWIEIGLLFTYLFFYIIMRKKYC